MSKADTITVFISQTATLEAEKGSQSRDAKIHSSLEAGSKSESIFVVFNVKNAEP